MSLVYDPKRSHASTLEQLPLSAEVYYDESVRSGLFEFQLIGKDGAGRRVYQKLLCGEPYGQPRALMTYREYSARVKLWAAFSSSIGVQRWTDPYGV